MSFNYNFSFTDSGIDMPDTPMFCGEAVWATPPDDLSFELALPHNPPYSAGFCGASPFPTSEPHLGYDASWTLFNGRTAQNFEAQQSIRSIESSSFNTAEQSIEMSFQGERRPSNSSGTTDNSYQDSLNDPREMNYFLTLESGDTEATNDSNIEAPIVAWNEVQCMIFSSRTATFIPQILYQPRGETDREKYVYTAILSPPILFYAENSSELGIALDEIQTRRLRDKDDVVLQGCGRSISVRIEWPGYRSWNAQLLTRDYRNPPGPIIKAKLAINLARCIRRFMKKMSTRRIETGADPAWRIGDRHGRIKYEDLVLVSLHHVSQGSWQPQLRLWRQDQGPSSRLGAL